VRRVTGTVGVAAAAAAAAGGSRRVEQEERLSVSERMTERSAPRSLASFRTRLPATTGP